MDEKDFAAGGMPPPVPAPSDDMLVKGDDAHAELPIALAEIPSRHPGVKQLLVPASETVPPQVKWEPENRMFHDKVFGVIYVLSFLAFVACGSFLVLNAHPRYQWVELDNTNNATALESYGTGEAVRIVSSHFQDDVQKCCALTKNDSLQSRADLCGELDVSSALRTWSEISAYDDNLYQDDDSWGLHNNTSKYQQGDGIFDAFLEAPEIIITLSLLALFLAVLWVVLLRFFAVPIVYATEVLKVAFFLYLCVTALIHEALGAGVVSLGCAVAIVAWDIYTFKELSFAGKVLAQAAKAFKQNPSLLCGFAPVLILYAGNAGLFVLFFARSFEVVEVQAVGDRCEYVSPFYTTLIVLYLSLAYLWSILLFNTMRLSIIANIVGSWHFHPDNKPSIGRAIMNLGTSLGTLSVASLVSTVAEKLNRMFLKEKMLMNCCNPIFWLIMPLYCLFGTCLRMLILMLTKFSVILHTFTGTSWMGSAKKVYAILKRHFKGGFVTEYASSSVLSLGSYVFSIGIYFLAWVWLDREFKTDTFVGVDDNVLMAVGWLFFALFNIWYPVLGLYLLILLNRWLSQSDIVEPQYWITPMAATFIACISMMFFTYLAGTFLDTVDVLFLCFAIDRDNNTDITSDEFANLVFEGVPTVLAEPDLEGTEGGNDEESSFPIVVTAVDELPAQN